MSAPHQGARAARPGSTRRQFLLGGAVAAGGAAAAIGADGALGLTPSGASADGTDGAAAALHGGATVPFYGAHQAGIGTDAQANGLFVALDLREGIGRDELVRMMRTLTDDAARMTRGEPALADSEPELALTPARLTVTFGFGPRFVARARGAAPRWLKALPAFAVDRLLPEFSDGDLLLQIAADDPLTVAHAARMLLKDTRSFATVRWSHQGFRRAHGSVKSGTTMRNLFGQVDGTTNPSPGTATFDEVVWSTEGWLAGGTGMVVRRIGMDLDKWDRLDRGGREQSVGRYLADGAPLTGTDEFDEPDFAATTAIGFPVIPEFSHVRRARGVDGGGGGGGEGGEEGGGELIFRRAYNYDDRPTGEGISRSGLIFVSFQADVERQFTPIQRRLDRLDLLNEWTVPIGSAVFAVPPGCAEGGYIGDTLL